PLLENCISRSNTCWLKMKQLTPVLLRWVANGGQGQNARRPVFPLPTGQAWCSVWWSRRNRSQRWQKPLVSLMRRSVASCFLFRSSVDSKKCMDYHHHHAVIQATSSPTKQPVFQLMSI